MLRRARSRGLRVAAHLPRGIMAWAAADSGVGSIEHAAESLLQSPIYAGHAADVHGALAWWRSPAGDSAIARLARLARSGVHVTPTLVFYEASIARGRTAEIREGRARLLPELVALTARLHRAGVPLLVGSDFAGPESGARPGRSFVRELVLLGEAGVSAAALAEAGSGRRLAAWVAGR